MASDPPLPQIPRLRPVFFFFSSVVAGLAFCPVSAMLTLFHHFILMADPNFMSSAARWPSDTSMVWYTNAFRVQF